jgi:hypothetical protein
MLVACREAVPKNFQNLPELGTIFADWDHLGA